LKPGGVFIIVDHAAELNSGTRDTDKMHRIDENLVKAEMKAAGFVLEDESDVLRNPADTHTLLVFDPGYLATELGSDLGSQRVAVIIVMIVGYCLLGAFFGVAYGAGEGGLRETYPGKLTSLDALLSGKLNSTNVARSILVGGGIAGWLLLAQNAMLLAVHGYRVGPDKDILASAFYRLPLLALIGERGADSVMQTTFGLLLPIALLRPRIKRPWIFFSLMPLFSILAATLTAGGEALWGTFVALQLVVAAAVFTVSVGFAERVEVTLMELGLMAQVGAGVLAPVTLHESVTVPL